MNEEIKNRLISDFEVWFFQKFVILYNTYKIKPWAIPIKFLLFNFHFYENVSKNKKINGKKNKNSDLFISISSNEKKIIELEHEEKEYEDPGGGLWVSFPKSRKRY